MKFLSWIQAVPDYLATDRIGDKNSEDDEPPSRSVAPRLHSRLSELDQVSVKDIMTPRALILALDVDVQLTRVRRLKTAKTPFFPVYRGDLDHLMGWVATASLQELMGRPSDEIQLTEYLRPLGVVPESASGADLADAFLASKSPLVAVKSHSSKTLGMVSLSTYTEIIFGLEAGPGHSAATSSQAFEPPILQLRPYEL
jgi:CBS domain containing-hemolysin-like protein